MHQSEGGDDIDFERATELGDSSESYYYEEEPNSKGIKGSDTDGSDTEGFYMPTLIHKSKTQAP